MLQSESQNCTNAKAELLHKWDQISSFQDRNKDMESLIKLLYKETMLNKQRWDAAREETEQLISKQLLPVLQQVQQAAAGLTDCMANEQARFHQLALHQLPTQRVSGMINSHQDTLTC